VANEWMNVLRIFVTKDVRKIYGLVKEDDCGIRINKEIEGYIENIWTRGRRIL
jgi:hypothetical protein